MKKLSIIIPVFNQKRYVRDCLQSLASQRLDDVEVLIRDAGSTDGTLDEIEKFEHIIDDLYSGPDGGQSDALAAGFDIATGRFLTWLNSDDVVLPGALENMIKCIDGGEREWFVGDTVLLNSDGRSLRVTRAAPCLAPPWSRIVQSYGPSTVFSRRLYERVGGLDRSFHYMMDTDLWWRFIETGARYLRAGTHWWGFRMHEQSKTTAELFSGAQDPKYDPSRYLRNAERFELYLRYGHGMQGLAQYRSIWLERLVRLVDLSYLNQVVETRSNQGRHWSNLNLRRTG